MYRCNAFIDSNAQFLSIYHVLFMLYKEKLSMVQSVTGLNSLQESFHIINNEQSGLSGIIAIHSTALGPAAGGCRFWAYTSDKEMSHDAARLARGMSYKNALAGLPFGGGKAVIKRPVGDFDRVALFRAFANAVAALEGRYITAEDVGTSIEDMNTVRQRTPYVARLEAKPGKAGGNPSPWTALGVFESMQTAANFTFGSDLGGLTIAVQGVGNVGANLCRLVKKAGGRLIIADVDRARVSLLAQELDAEVVSTNEIHSVEADIFAPCALGAVLNGHTIPSLKARLVCGGANNQLATNKDGEALLAREIVYAPDYLVNAGGIINVAAEYLGETTEQVRERVGQIANRLTTVLATADCNKQPPHIVADEMAEKIIIGTRRAVA
jgi:leucine dehydrogenase